MLTATGAVAIAGGADALQAGMLGGHRVGFKDASLKRKLEIVPKECEAVG